MTRRGILLLLALLGGSLTLAAGVGIAFFATTDLQALAERQASAALDRRVSIAALTIAWGNPVRIELRDLRVANVSWGSEPDMIRIERLSAALDPWALLRGIMRFETLRLDRPAVLLERNEADERNWRFKGSGNVRTGGLAIVPQNRTQFPTLIDFSVGDGAVIYRAAKRDDIRIGFNDATVRMTDDDAPASLVVDGSYNGAPVRLAADTEPVKRMRDASVPFGARFTLTAVPGRIGFAGTMAEPLDFEGVAGNLTVDTRSLAEFLSVFGIDVPVPASLAVKSGFDKRSDTWQLIDASGRFGGNNFGGHIVLAEAGRGEPDHLMLALNFAQLDLDRVTGPRPSATQTDPSLALDQKPGALIEARITAQELAYDGRHLVKFALRGRLGAGAAEVDTLSFAFAGGTVGLSGRAETSGNGTRIAADAALVGADADALVVALGGDAGQIAGAIDGRASVVATGTTVGEALRHSDGAAFVTMNGGHVARHLVERISLDLRSLFRRNEGMAEITCMLGVATVKDGLAAIAPLRLETPEMALIGGGFLDLPTRQIDLTLKAEEGEAPVAAPALRLPVRIKGPLDKIDTGLGPAGRLPPTADVTATLRLLSRDAGGPAAPTRCLN